MALGPAATATPVPVRLTVWVVPPTALLSVMVRVPVTEPVAVGVNVTLMVQEAPAATEPAQPVAAKGAAVEAAETVSATLPLFVMVTVLAALVVPSF